MRVLTAPDLVGRLHRDDPKRFFLPALVTNLAHSADTLRSARLLFSEELAIGKLGEEELTDSRVVDAIAPKPFASRPVAALQRLATKLGALTYERHCLARLIEARQALLGGDATAPPRFLVRVDEFPHAADYDRGGRYGREQFMRFHSIMRSADVSYLLAVSPRVSREFLDPEVHESRGLARDEIETLADLVDDGVTIALHGYEHRTRERSPRRHSELSGLGHGELTELIDRSSSAMAAVGLQPKVFVPPFNRFEAAQYGSLAERFDVVCGGPESVAMLGFHATPQWRGDAVYLPAYPPFYGRASTIVPAVERLTAAQPGTWIPVVLHWGWEADDGWTRLEELVRTMAPLTVDWESFLATVSEIRARPAG